MLRPQLPSRGRSAETPNKPVDVKPRLNVAMTPTIRSAATLTMSPAPIMAPTPTHAPASAQTQTPRNSILRPQVTSLTGSGKRAVMAPPEKLERVREIPRMTPNLRRTPSYSELPSPGVSRSPSPAYVRDDRSRSASASPIARTPSGDVSPVRPMTPTLGITRRSASPAPGPLYTSGRVEPAKPRSGSVPTRMTPRLYSERTAVVPVNLDRIREELERDMKKELDKIRTSAPVLTPAPKKTLDPMPVATSAPVLPPGPGGMQIRIPIKSGRVAPGFTPEIYREAVLAARAGVPSAEPRAELKAEPKVEPKTEKDPASNTEGETRVPSRPISPSHTTLPTPPGTPRGPYTPETYTPQELLPASDNIVSSRPNKLRPSTQAVRKEQARVRAAAVPANMRLPEPAALSNASTPKSTPKTASRPIIMQASRTLPDAYPSHVACDFPDVEVPSGWTAGHTPIVNTPVEDRAPAGVDLTEEQITEALKLYMRVNAEDYAILHCGDIIAYVNRKGKLIKDVTLKRMSVSSRTKSVIWALETFYSHKYRNQYVINVGSIQRVWKRVGLESASLARGFDLLLEDLKDMQAFLEQKYGHEYVQFVRQRQMARGPRFRAGDALTPKMNKPHS